MFLKDVIINKMIEEKMKKVKEIILKEFSANMQTLRDRVIDERDIEKITELQNKHKHMEEFCFKLRGDGIFDLDLNELIIVLGERQGEWLIRDIERELFK